MLGHRRPGRLRPHRAGAADLRRRPRKAGGEVAAATGKPVAIHAAAGRDRRRHRLSDRGPQAARPVSRHVVRREHQCRRDRRATPGGGVLNLAARGASVAAGVQGARASARRARGHRRQPVRRQPAEGAAVALAGDRAEGADPRRADARRRHRRQVARSTGIIDELAQQRHRGDRDLERAARRSSASATACWSCARGTSRARSAAGAARRSPRRTSWRCAAGVAA